MAVKPKNDRPVRGTCPTCGTPVEWRPDDAASSRHFPFCSERCELADLDKWFEEEYRIERPATEADVEQED